MQSPNSQEEIGVFSLPRPTMVNRRPIAEDTVRRVPRPPTDPVVLNSQSPPATRRRMSFDIETFEFPSASFSIEEMSFRRHALGRSLDDDSAAQQERSADPQIASYPPAPDNVDENDLNFNFPDVPEELLVLDEEGCESEGSIADDLEFLNFIEQVVAADVEHGGYLYEMAMDAVAK
jgi:hypothetical protein